MKKRLTQTELLELAKTKAKTKRQGDMATAMGISASYFSQMVNGERPINYDFASYFGYQPVTYFEYEHD